MSAPPRRLRGDDGFTLAELVISTMIMGIVLTAVTAAVIVGLRNGSRSVDMLGPSTDAALLSHHFTADVQSAMASVRLWARRVGFAVLFAILAVLIAAFVVKVWRRVAPAVVPEHRLPRVLYRAELDRQWTVVFEPTSSEVTSGAVELQVAPAPPGD